MNVQPPADVAAQGGLNETSSGLACTKDVRSCCAGAATGLKKTSSVFVQLELFDQRCGIAD